MYDPDLQTLQTLNGRQKALLRRAGLHTPSELLLPPEPAVLKLLQPISPADFRALLIAVEDAICPVPAKLSEKGKGKAHAAISNEVLAVGDGAIDRALGGGIRLDGSVTEITGESSAGKTQLALALTVRAVLLPPPPLASTTPKAGPSRLSRPSSHAIYLSSEGHLPTPRLLELLPADLPNDEGPGDVLDRIHFLAANDVEALDHTLSYLIPGLTSRLSASGGHVRLIVLDSLAALLRTSFENDKAGLAKRSEAICLLADKLKSLGVQMGCAIVVLNQVKDVFGENPWLATTPSFSTPFSSSPLGSQPSLSQRPPPSPLATSGGPSLLPPAVPARAPSPQMGYRDQSRFINGSSAQVRKEAALGLVWTNCVSTRVMLSRTERFVRVAVRGLGGGVEEADEGERLRIRGLDVVFSNNAPPSRVDYVVQTSRIASLATLKGIEPSSKRPAPGGGAAGREKRARAVARLTQARDGEDGGEEADEYGDGSWVLEVDEEEIRASQMPS